jgi:uncharacterized protein (TIGR02246 family)
MILFLLFILSVESRAADPDRKDIDLFFDDITKAMNAKSADSVADAFSSQGEVISLAGGIFKGSVEIRSFFEEGFKGPYKTAQFENYIQYVRFQDPDHAVVDGVWKVIGASIPNYPSCGIFLVNLSKQSGRWKSDMFYSAVPEQGHTSEHGRTLSWTKICNGN